jgi:hypothetical protein
MIGFADPNRHFLAELEERYTHQGNCAEEQSG